MNLQFIKTVPAKTHPGKQMIKSELKMPQNMTLGLEINYKLMNSTSIKRGYHTDGSKTFMVTDNMACELTLNGESWAPDMSEIIQTSMDI
jgi:hypothetical protein